MHLKSVLMKSSLIHWSQERPWPAVQLVMTIPFQRSGFPIEFCVKDVKGPFDSRPKSCKIPLGWTVLHLVASYLDLHSSNLTFAGASEWEVC